MYYYARRAVCVAGAAAFALVPPPALAQHDVHGQEPVDPSQAHASHEMWMAELGSGWRLIGMAQVFPVVTIGAPGEEGSPLRETEAYLTQPALMANVESHDSRWVLRTTLNLEGLTLDDGELTFGGWGEGFLDKRHPHTWLHELMLSANLWERAGASLSLSAGKGFAPYGTDDPMARPGLKYPTNHHLSQILERWTVNAVLVRGRWSIEAGVFAGTEPESPGDLSNIDGFGDSWSARVARRWGGGAGPMAEWEASASYGNVAEEHDGETERTSLWNAALRHARPLAAGRLYALAEASRSDPDDHDGYFSILAETRLELARHQPYVRIELATRPEYARAGEPGSAEFFRYDHDDDPIGATRWLIATVAYAYEVTGYPVSLRPFVELQAHRVDAERGGLEPEEMFGASSFWGVTLGVRIFLGGGPMRMGSYGVLDPMSAVRRQATAEPGMPMQQLAPRERSRVRGAFR